MSYSILCWDDKEPEHVFIRRNMFRPTPQGEIGAKYLAESYSENWDHVEIVKTVKTYDRKDKPK